MRIQTGDNKRSGDAHTLELVAGPGDDSSQEEADGHVKVSLPAGGGGGSQPFKTIRRSILFSDFVDSLINPGSYRFAPLHDFVPNDALLMVAAVCTETFDDSNFGSLNFEVTDDGNNTAYSAWSSGGQANPSGNGGLPLQPADDSEQWVPNTSPTTPTQPGLLDAPLALGLCDNGTLAGDGAAGSIEVVLFYLAAP